MRNNVLLFKAILRDHPYRVKPSERGRVNNLVKGGYLQRTRERWEVVATNKLWQRLHRMGEV